MKFLKLHGFKGLFFFSLLIMLFGQVLFQFVNFHFHISQISAPFVVFLYLFSIIKIIVNPSVVQIFKEDILIFFFFFYLAISYLLFGTSNTYEFWVRLFFVIVGPYLIGRQIGKNFQISVFNFFIVIFILNVAVLLFEISKDLSLLNMDRFILYDTKDEFGSGGSTQGFVAMVFGCALVVAAISKGLWPKDFNRKLMLGVSSIFLVLFGSRSSIVSSIIAITISYLMANRFKFMSIIKFVVVASVGIIFFILFVPTSRQDFFNEAIKGEGSAGIRSLLLLDAWNLIREAPILGIGASNFGYRYSFEFADFASPHSLFLHILTELGLLGLLIFLLFIIYIFNKARLFFRQKNDNKTNSIQIVVFTIWLFYIIDMQFYGNMFYDYQLYIISGLIVAIFHKRKNEGYLFIQNNSKNATAF